MSEYFKLNFKKFIFCYLFLFFGFTILQGLWFIFKHSEETPINLPEALSFLKYWASISLFVSIWLFLESFIKYQRVKKVLTTYPITKVIPTDLKVRYENEKSRWQFLEMYLAGRVKGYQVTLTYNKGELRISVQLDLDQLTDEHVSELEDQLGEKLERDWFGVACVYNRKTLKASTHQEMLSDLNHMLDYLKRKSIASWQEDL